MVIVLSTVILLVGCGGVSNSVEGMYALEDVVYGETGHSSKVYRAENQKVQDVAKVIADKNTPKESSKEDAERMFLVYNDQLIHVMKDAEKPEDTLVEVSEKEFVRRHYNTSFLETYLMFRIVDDLFGLGRNRRGDYGGYIGTDGRYSRNSPTTGSIRYGSRGATSPRGGGPGTGK
jgi:hypothetical protein